MNFILLVILFFGNLHHPPRTHLLPCSDYCPGEPVPCIQGK
jgi:hypothetical protein